MNGEQAQHAIDEATERVFDKGIENATQADLMFFGFGYLAHIIKESRPRTSPSSKGKWAGIGGILGAGGTWLAENVFSFIGG